jgi:HD-GYP domain-containing protein (c-di-GMP phosphodiesterase class II)/DNA-binding CsgD family transcriptional regulator
MAAQRDAPGREGIRLAELIGALSVAVDLGMSLPAEAGLRSCVLAVELGGALGLDEPELTRTYYLALLRLVGCTSTAHEEVSIFGQELAGLPGIRTVDTRPLPFLAAIARTLAADQPPLARAGRVAGAVRGLPRMSRATAAHCEVAERLAARLGLAADLQVALTHAFERWDGQGRPCGLAGEAIAISARLVSLASDVVAFYELGGVEAAVAMARDRAGHKHDPRAAERFCQMAERLVASLEGGSTWERLLAAEPGPRPSLAGAEADRAIRALADFADLKTPFFSGHSSGVADLAVAAAERCRLSSSEVGALGRAALLHDLGRSAVSAAIWDKPGPLSEGEWERVRLHPYWTERVLSRSRALAAVGTIAVLHHERLDGSGYHRGFPAQLQPPPARLLAAADVYHALREPRPHRPAHSAEQAAEQLSREARAGRLCPDAVAGVLAAAGHRARPTRREWPGGLSEREVEVLRLLARGLPNRQIAERLVVSERTVHHHVEHIYDKIDVSTRAGATLFAIQHDLLAPAEE